MLASLLLPFDLIYLCLDLHSLGLCYLSPCYWESASCLILARSVTLHGLLRDNVERISHGSLWQSLKISVATLTDPHVILHQLWCA